VRALYDDGATKAQETTREYVLMLEGDAGTGALLNAFGGKITTYRHMAEAALTKIESVLGRRGPAWTRGATLPGGDFPVDGFEALLVSLRALAPKLPAATVRRLARAYGTEARTILAAGDLGLVFGADLGQREVDFLVEKEWARTAEDILWRRSKLGLRFTAEETAALARYLESGHNPTQASG